uniref:Uncharacterized protein n=1 Tax=Anguilla anguilla TaxID=7936 RepID=A0A0E9QZN1_ANGAN
MCTQVFIFVSKVLICFLNNFKLCILGRDVPAFVYIK